MASTLAKIFGRAWRVPVLCVAGASLVANASAAEFPERTITMVVPYAAGGSTDVLGRVLAKVLSAHLKQQVVVENVGGAGGTIGTSRVAKSNPDGYTILFHNMGHATAPSLYRGLSYDPVESFEPIGSVADVPMILVARKDFGPKTLPEVIAYARANPDKITIANAGVGSTTHLCSVLLGSVTNTKMSAVPYKGTGPALNDLVGGHVDLLCDQPAATTGFITKGAIKPIALAARTRLNTLPEVPTFAESGLKDFELAVWHGLYAPKSTPKPVIEKLATALKVALKDGFVNERFAALGAQVATDKLATPDGLHAHVKAEVVKLGSALRSAGIAPE